MSEITRLPELLTERQAAERLGVSPETVRRLVRAGAIGSYKVGRKRRFADHHLRAYLESVECRPKKNDGPMEAVTSPSATITRIGIDAGSTPPPSRRGPLPSALATLRKPSAC